MTASASMRRQRTLTPSASRASLASSRTASWVGLYCACTQKASRRPLLTRLFATGFLFGGAIGLFLSGLSSTGPEGALLQQAPPAGGSNGLPAVASTKSQVKQVFKEMATKSWSSARSFAKIGALFTGFECAFESYRARHDVTNTLLAGCATGAVLGIKSGPKAALAGCAGFAAFSAAIEHFMEPSSPEA